MIHKDDIVMEGSVVKQSKHLREWRQRWFFALNCGKSVSVFRLAGSFMVF